MKSAPGFLSELQVQLESVPLEVLESVNRPGGFEVSDLLDSILRPKDYTVCMPHQVDLGTVKTFEDIDVDTRKIGENIVADNQVAFCLLFDGTDDELPFLVKKLEASKNIQEIWLLIPPSFIPEIYLILSSLGTSNVKVMTNYETFALTPDNRLIDGFASPKLSICGRGDLIPSLQNNGILEEFVSVGGKYVYVTPVKNPLLSPDPMVLGQHVIGKKPVTCEVVDRHRFDKRDILCNHAGFDQLVGQHRLMYPADPDYFTYVGVDSYVFDANLDFNTMTFSWHRMKRTIDNKIVISYERSLNDLTFTFQTQYVKVPRTSRLMDHDSSE